MYINNNPTYRIYQTGGDDITPLAYEKIRDNRYTITPPEKRYIVQTDTYDNTWTLGASKDQPTNIWEYSRDTEIKKRSAYIISIMTLQLTGKDSMEKQPYPRTKIYRFSSQA
ncbi:MAG: hypothetical protein ABIG84_04260 [archaeon]